MKLSISEILNKTSNLSDINQRVHYLRENDSQALRVILTGVFSPYVKWLLPEGEPPYKPCDLVDQHHRLYTEARKMYLFVEGGNPNLNQLRREALFIELLESLDPADAKLVIAMKDHQMPYANITLELVTLTFPGLIPV
jgi:hypothetical protein